jgi:hypothetical protein
MPMFLLGVWGIYDSYAIKSRRRYSDWEWDQFQPALRTQRFLFAKFIIGSLVALAYLIYDRIGK